MKPGEPSSNENAFAIRFEDTGAATRYRDRFASGRHRRVHLRESVVLANLLDKIGPVASALDMACGAGRLSPLLARYADRVILADSSATMLALAKEKCVGESFEFLRTDAGKIDLKDGAVDLVFCHRLLHHLPDQETRWRVIKELKRVSRRFIILSFYPPGWRTRMRLRLSSLIGRALKDGRPLRLKAFVAEMARQGLRPVDMGRIRPFPFPATFIVFEPAATTGPGTAR